MEFTQTCIAAMNAYNQENYVPFEEFHSANFKNPENIAIEKDIFEKFLSPDAQTTVIVICNSPELFKTKIEDSPISWTQVRNYLRKTKGYKWRKIDKIRNEIIIWLKETL